MPRNHSTIIVVDDEEMMRQYLYDVLSRHGYDCKCFEGSLSALAYMASAGSAPNLMLTDISMPGMDGMDLLRTVKTVSPRTPVIMVSGLYELALAIDALKSGASDYLLKPANPRDVIRLVNRYLGPDARNGQEALRAALDRFLRVREGYGRDFEDVREIFEVLGFRRFETLQHSKRVACFAELIGRSLDIPEPRLSPLKLGALLHDIGKIAIPHNVLMKPGALTEAEWTVMRLHPRIGWELMSEFSELTEEADIVYSHHEKHDGRGYPRNLRGEQIPLGARVFAIADALDAITSDRPYRAGRSFPEALAEIQRHSNTQFDPRVVQAFLDIPLAEFEAIRGRYPDSETNT
ncbi:MAG: HD domain-containing phosphohydrolase [Bryobacterales bacterium]